MRKKEMSLKEALLGKVKKMTASEFAEFKKKKFSEPLAGKESVCYCVCTQCQNIFEADQDVASGFIRVFRNLGGTLGQPSLRITDRNGYYIEMNYCFLCETRKEVKISIRKK